VQKKTDACTVFFALLGSLEVKVPCKMLMILTLGLVHALNFRIGSANEADPRLKREADVGEGGVQRRRTHRDGRRRVQPDPSVYVADFNFNTTRGTFAQFGQVEIEVSK